jgi:hypothetical protein
MRIGIATDHGGFGLKEELLAHLRDAEYVASLEAGSQYGTVRSLLACV